MAPSRSARRQATAPQRHGSVGPHLEQVAFRADTGRFRPPLTFRNRGLTFMPCGQRISSSCTWSTVALCQQIEDCKGAPILTMTSCPSAAQKQDRLLTSHHRSS